MASRMTDVDFLICNKKGDVLLTSDAGLVGKSVRVPEEIVETTFSNENGYEGRSTVGVYEQKKFVVGVPMTDESGNVLVNPGSAVLLGPGGCRFAQTGSAVPQIVGCHFPLGMLHDLKNTAGRDFSRLFAPGERTVLYAPVQWQSRIRTLLEMMASASTEQDYPGPLYLLLILHYVEQECIAESSAVARPHNETVEQICAYLAANYRQKFSLTEVAAQFYLSPYYLSRLFRRVTGQSIVDYINNRRIEAAQKLLETTELSISAVAEQTGFASAAHFRRVFREVMGTGPLQYRKGHKK